MPEDTREPVAPAEAARPPSQSPAGTRSGDDLLARFKWVGEDHPSYRKLKEALVHSQSAAVEEAVAELEAIKHGNENSPGVATKPRAPVYWLWILLCGILLASVLFSLSQQYIAANLKEIIARNSPGPIEIIAGEALGGWKSAEITAHVLKEVDDLKPDHCLFLGHQLAKKEIVEYLSALSRIAKVSVVLGFGEDGKSQLADPQSPLRQYRFTELWEAPMLIRSQVLMAFNNRTGQAVAFVGTYPCDQQDSSRGEHTLIVIHGFDQCSQLYSVYEPLLKNSTRKSYAR